MTRNITYYRNNDKEADNFRKSLGDALSRNQTNFHFESGKPQGRNSVWRIKKDFVRLYLEQEPNWKEEQAGESATPRPKSTSLAPRNNSKPLLLGYSKPKCIAAAVFGAWYNANTGKHEFSSDGKCNRGFTRAEIAAMLRGAYLKLNDKGDIISSSPGSIRQEPLIETYMRSGLSALWKRHKNRYFQATASNERDLVTKKAVVKYTISDEESKTALLANLDKTRRYLQAKLLDKDSSVDRRILDISPSIQ